MVATCVSVIVQSERCVAVLTVAQWGQRNQTGVIFCLGGHHINRWLWITTAVGEILGPLGLAHQTFDRGKTRNNHVIQSHSPLTLSPAAKSFHYELLIMQDNYSSRFFLGSQQHGDEFYHNKTFEIVLNVCFFYKVPSFNHICGFLQSSILNMHLYWHLCLIVLLFLWVSRDTYIRKSGCWWFLILLYMFNSCCHCRPAEIKPATAVLCLTKRNTTTYKSTSSHQQHAVQIIKALCSIANFQLITTTTKSL